MLIAIEGCLGVGKTTVAKGLAAHRESTLLLEDFERHPFLRAFYKDPVGTATETEFAFLLLHFHQLKQYADATVAAEIVSDFHLGKDLIYADLNLTDPKVRKIFGNLYEVCSEKTPSPDLLILLTSGDELLIDRIRARNRDFEQDIDTSYYATVNAAYAEFYSRYPGKRILVSMDDWDFIAAPELYERLSDMVDRELGTRA